ncbi:TlpA family protein disulfide reductase [Methyloterricola oryzae]|uniref:TlpA family protein disulfide reductase n=1 Tax=Methyloterricola oryzae TaxID=1495050 RepID=UPI0005EBD883|nr:TlpA disulfide reductase family protein [Methyloterricola oryzae]
MNNFTLSLLALAFLGTPARPHAMDAGTAAPACELETFKGAKATELSRYRGKVVLLDFWASWCGPCAQSMPFLDELQKQLGPKGLQVLAVNLDDNRQDAESFLSKHPVQIDVMSDGAGACPGRFGVEIMPSSYLIDRKGNIRHIQLGFHKDEGPKIRQSIEKLLAEG